ncbi:response regulator [Sorangium sp. So ce327]|uniref:response regulator n=1 Tax=Sorangium sp. So ce327 TaxID=3133301 RepID=UPI003F5DB819
MASAGACLDRRRGGLGLGLSLVHSLIAMHGGSVEAHSEGPGRGSTFRVRLPLSSAPARSIGRPEPVRPATASREGSLRVLVVEDNRDTADILKQLLALLGHQAEVAYTGPAGLAMGRTLAPDVVLCDLGLPGMDGYALARALRADPATARAYLIAQTGYGHAEDRRRSREARFDLHMTKPIDPIELERVLCSVGARA